MLYDLIMKELANYKLNEMCHEAEKKDGYDIEYHEKSILECNYKWCAVGRIARQILGTKAAMECSIEATELAKSEFKKGNYCID